MKWKLLYNGVIPCPEGISSFLGVLRGGPVTLAVIGNYSPEGNHDAKLQWSVRAVVRSW